MFVICWRLQRVEPKVSHMPCSENWTTGAHVQEFLLGAMTVINFQGLLLQITTSWMTQNNRSLSPPCSFGGQRSEIQVLAGPHSL